MTVRQAWFTLLPIMCMRKMPCFLSMSCLKPHPTCNATEVRGKADIDHNDYIEVQCFPPLQPTMQGWGKKYLRYICASTPVLKKVYYTIVSVSLDTF